MPKTSTSFKTGNKAAEKWTIDEALKLGNDLINWLKEKDDEGNDKGHIFYEEFLCIENDYYVELISYLCEKFVPFSNLIKKAKKIQELKLIKFGVADRLQATMTIFVLKNHHDYKDKVIVDNVIEDKRKDIDQLFPSEEELNDEENQS